MSRHVKQLASAWGPVVAWAALMFVLSAQPSLPAPNVPGFDKLAHALEFAALGALLTRALSFAGRFTSGHAAVWAIGLASLFGASDEIHQLFVPGRSSSLFDLAADVVGASLGAYGCIALLSGRARGNRPG